MEAREWRLFGLGGALSAAFVAAVVAVALLAGRKLPDGPTEVAWDRDACATCGMHVGEPDFAAQVQLRDGRTRFYDDPGCLLLDDEASGPEVHAIWFHHYREDRWIRGDRVGFVPVSPTPMGFGLGAADAVEGTWTVAGARDHARRVHALGAEER